MMMLLHQFSVVLLCFQLGVLEGSPTKDIQNQKDGSSDPDPTRNPYDINKMARRMENREGPEGYFVIPETASPKQNRRAPMARTGKEKVFAEVHGDGKVHTEYVRSLKARTPMGNLQDVGDDLALQQEKGENDHAWSAQNRTSDASHDPKGYVRKIKDGSKDLHNGDAEEGLMVSDTVPGILGVLLQQSSLEEQETILREIPFHQLLLFQKYLEHTQPQIGGVQQESLEPQSLEQQWQEQQDQQESVDQPTAEELANLLANTASKDERTAVLMSLTPEQRADVKAHLALRAGVSHTTLDDQPVSLVRELGHKFMDTVGHVTDFLRVHGLHF